MDLNQGSGVKLDRLTLGPDAEHWGVHRAADGSFQRFSSVGNRDRFTRLLESETDKIKSNNQIGFVTLGFSGDWAFSVNGHVEHKCGKPFQNELTGGWRARKRVSVRSISNLASINILTYENVNNQTIVLSPFARVWIIVWDDGTLSHNLPFNIASQVEDYCQLQHSLKPNGNQSNPGRPKAPKAKPPRNNQQASTSSTQQQQAAPNPTPNANPTDNLNSLANATADLRSLANATQSLARQVSQTPNRQRNVASASGAQTLPKPTLAPPPAVQTTFNAAPVPKASIPAVSTSNQQPTARLAPTQPPTSTLPRVRKAPAVTQPASQVPFTRAGLQQASRGVPSQVDRPISRVETIYAKPRVYVPPKKLSTTLRQLDATGWKDSYDYEKVVRLFQDGWQHLHLKRCPKIKRIFAVDLPDHLNESYQEYKDDLEIRHGRSGINEKLVFHGTARSCSLGEGEGDLSLCEISTCSLCSILRTSFLVSKAGSAGRTFKRCVVAVRVALEEQSGD
ncbi:hypothetical protein FRC05_002903 [Tulasnella sp. 425]|nr:hypothetical protein FRC05_002903 [Tulasnella sp. 425]